LAIITNHQATMEAWASKRTIVNDILQKALKHDNFHFVCLIWFKSWHSLQMFISCINHAILFWHNSNWYECVILYFSNIGLLGLESPLLFGLHGIQVNRQSSSID
ncbi:hypothetical protein ACJX0J_024901, partial [Zea mays]